MLFRSAAVPPLAWLDAVNALHVFRILQEAIANIVKHSGAGEISVTCHTHAQNGRGGVQITLSDNGIGFDLNAKPMGRGLANMASRAISVHGEFAVESRIGGGTTTLLWLPFER